MQLFRSVHRIINLSRRSFALHRHNTELMECNINSTVLNFMQGEKAVRTQVEVDGDNMTLEDVIELGRGANAFVSEKTIARLERSRAVVDRIVDSEVPTYGINTGFGLLSHTNVSLKELANLQHNLIRSHASGVGTALAPEVVRRVMALRINTLARGRSGISVGTFQKLIKLFNSGCTPEVPIQGTVGASGDLAPLAHIALGLMGEGNIFDPKQQKYRPADQVMKDYNLEPAKLVAKDGLSLVNGTQFITGVGSQALELGIICAQVAQPIAALTLISMNGHMNAMDYRVQAIRPHAGGGIVARIMRGLIPPDSHTVTDRDVQDFYSLRCIPQVHGCVLENLVSSRQLLEVEMNSSTDNPLIFEDAICPITGKALPNVISAGNFHGEYPAKALDTLALYVGELGRVSVARTMILIDPNRNRGLPAFLAPNPGVNSGFMCWELTAAALDAENRTLSMPASAETANTGAGKEDHVSMGGFSARKAVQVVENVHKILAIELMMAVHAIQLRVLKDPDFKIPTQLREVYETCAKISPYMKHDRYLKLEYDRLLEFIKSELPRMAHLVNANPSTPDTAADIASAIEEAKNISGENLCLGGAADGAGKGLHFGASSKLLHTASTPISEVKQAQVAGPNIVQNNTRNVVPFSLSDQSSPSYLKHPRAFINQILSRRKMQTNIGEQDSFALDILDHGSTSTTLQDITDGVVRRGSSTPTTSPIFIVDASEDDFGSRANFGRGHIHSSFEQGCPTSYEVFIRRLSNVAMNKLNKDMAKNICLLGSVDSSDLTKRCQGLNPSIDSDRAELIACVKSQHQRLTDIIARVYTQNHLHTQGVYLVNGDHNHMLSAIAGVKFGLGGSVSPVVVYIDIHADSRPVEDGPHSGTWCSEAFQYGWIEQAYVVGINPLSNSEMTLDNLDKNGAVYRPYTWDAIKAGETSLLQAAKEISSDIVKKYGQKRPVIVSICGDSVLSLPASAGTGTIGYSADEVYSFVSMISKKCQVSCLTVAELKTSLSPQDAPLVGEFLTQCLYAYHRNSSKRLA